MPAGPGPEFPLWLGLISLPLAFLGDLCWFPPPPSGLRATKERHTTVHRGEGVGREQSLWAKVLRPACHAHGLALHQTAITSKRSAPSRCPLELYDLHDRQCYFRPHLLPRELSLRVLLVTGSVCAPTLSTPLPGTQVPSCSVFPPKH